ncbi:Hsp70 family protein [Solwaraspora sp. WMMD1047]|uniref:Hsp70 family protein n=1 Tax=Solwaraspora sp. WMMD1047 TaxID=3016102 RepID=UPI002416447B|nr:Hsp70 family protein [Solwaraspora sp. WMMD1047]MDG4829307.1 Hsp70 family protein [Solwaraspora sp. WMMD1047]
MPAVLGVDFGTSHTVAALRMPGGRTESLLFDVSPLLPSAVFAQPDGQLLVGHDALRGSRVDPGRLEPNPKRRIDDGTLLLGDVETTVSEVFQAVLVRVAQTGQRALGVAPRPVVLTHPAGWGAHRRRILAEAAAGAGLGAVRLMAEPVAAALYFTEVLGHRVGPGGTLVVYDLGGGTFDISAVRRLADGGWEVLAAAGLDDVGGVDIDDAIVAWTATQADAAGAGWRFDAGLDGRRRRQQAQQEARLAKEQLSRAVTAPIVLPWLARDLYLTRDEFDRLARPLLDRTVALTTSTLFASGVAADRLAGVFLVGGSSRIPLVATMLHRALGVAPTVIDQPELVVAHGSLAAPPREGGSAPGGSSPIGIGAARADSAPVPPAGSPGPAAGDQAPAAADQPGPTEAAPPSVAGPARRSRVDFAVAVLLGVLVGAATTAYPLVTSEDGALPWWTERYAWQLMPVAGLLAGLWSSRRGTALVAQVVAGVAAGLVGLALVRAGRTFFDMPWGTPVEIYYWEHYPDAWFVALLGGFVVAGLAVEAALAATARLGPVRLAIAAAAGALSNLLLLVVLDWTYEPPLSRVAIDTLFGYPVVVLLAWLARRAAR